MQARVVRSSRYGIVTAFSGMEFVKHEWRPVPAKFEESARTHDLLEIREGKQEKEVVQKQLEEQAPKFMRARLDSSYERDTLRTMGMEFDKVNWMQVPAGYEESARAHEHLQVWEIDQPEPSVELATEAPDEDTAQKTPRTNKKIFKRGDKKDTE